jgi:Membrane domain of glycerophosphoryl diester phosphodiesterase
MDTVLRPMSTSQVLDRTFSLYRQHFRLFAGIAALPPALLLLGQLGFLSAGTLSVLSGRMGLQIAAIVAAVLTGMALLALWIFGYALCTGASVYAVTRVHLGHKTSIADAYKLMFPYAGTVLGIVVLVFLAVGAAFLVAAAVIGVPFLAIGFALKGQQTIVALLTGIGVLLFVPAVVCVVFYISARLSLAVPSAVVERLGVVESLKRSWGLAQGSVLRLVLVNILAAIISFALSAVLSLPYFIGVALALTKKSPAAMVPFIIWQYIGAFLARSIAFPIATIAVSLIYYDERVRKEAFDLQLMMEAMSQPQPPPLQREAAPGATSPIG